MFEIKEEICASFVCLLPVGRLDTIQAAFFDKTVQDYAKRGTFLVINFSECSYLSSSGIRVLLSTSRELASTGGQLVLAGLSGEMFQVLQIAGLDSDSECCNTGGG